MSENSKEKELNLVAINSEINIQLADETVKRALLATTFKGLEPTVMKQAIMEGMIRGFTFKDFLEKNVYAIPFGKSYSITQSIDYIRKIGMRAGIVGKSAPMYEWNENKKPETCTITVKRLVNGYIGEYTATVFFDEFSTGRNLWASKPKMMLAKVAEMHALRMACPEELSQAYIEEELESEAVKENNVVRVENARNESKPIQMGNFLNNENKEGADAPHQDDAPSIQVGEREITAEDLDGPVSA